VESGEKDENEGPPIGSICGPARHRSSQACENRLVSRCDQTNRVGDHTFEIAAGEAIHTENSHKYTIAGFAQLAAAAGLTLRRHWTDPQAR